MWRVKRLRLWGGGNHLSSRSKGFTLAEVLVTLGIIGVVSAMTVPSLMQNHQRKTYVTQLHKFYIILSQGLVQVMADKNAVNLKEAGLTTLSEWNSFFNTYYKIIQDCKETQTPCMASSYKKISGQFISGNTSRYITLADGTSLGYFNINDPDASLIAVLYVDVNGAKGPNLVGRDLFAIYVYNNGIVDDYSTSLPPISKEKREEMFNTCCINNSGNWNGCFGKILNDNWEMTY